MEEILGYDYYLATGKDNFRLLTSKQQPLLTTWKRRTLPFGGKTRPLLMDWKRPLLNGAK